MKIFAYAVSVLIVSTLFNPQGFTQSTKQSGAVKEKSMCTAMGWQWAKGGVGLINEHLYVVVNLSSNDRNELIIKTADWKEQRWKGKIVTKAEVVIVYEGKVFSSQDIPDQFDLSKAVVISFEQDKIHFFDFQSMHGGYYERNSE